MWAIILVAVGVPLLFFAALGSCGRLGARCQGSFSLVKLELVAPSFSRSFIDSFVHSFFRSFMMLVAVFIVDVLLAVMLLLVAQQR